MKVGRADFFTAASHSTFSELSEQVKPLGHHWLLLIEDNLPHLNIHAQWFAGRGWGNDINKNGFWSHSDEFIEWKYFDLQNLSLDSLEFSDALTIWESYHGAQNSHEEEQQGPSNKILRVLRVSHFNFAYKLFEKHCLMQRLLYNRWCLFYILQALAPGFNESTSYITIYTFLMIPKMLKSMSCAANRAIIEGQSLG